MTRADRRDLSVGWQTWLVVAGTVAIGRGLAGGGFGYTLFAVLWGPIVAALVSDGWRRRRSLVDGLIVVGLFSTVFWAGDWPITVAGALTGWLTVAVGALIAVKRLLTTLRLPGTGLSVIAWIVFVALPLLLAERLPVWIGEAALAVAMKANPVLMANAIDSAAGDWTHQNIAYSTLTRLGQDVTFQWPGAETWAGYLLIAAAGAIVPRGTIRLYRSRNASSRHSAGSTTPQRRINSSNSSSER